MKITEMPTAIPVPVPTMSAADFVGVLATVFTVGMFLTGSQICLQIWKKRNTNDLSILPFLTTLINCTLWLNFGFAKKDGILIFVNGVGALLQIVYAVFFYWMCIDKKTIMKKILGTFVCLFVIVLIEMFSPSTESKIQILGYLASIAVLICLASPMALLAVVIKSKSTELLPFYLIFSGFVMAILWFLYGYLIDDIFVQVPNAAGAVISGLQLSLFFIYPHRSSSTK